MEGGGGEKEKEKYYNKTLKRNNNNNKSNQYELLRKEFYGINISFKNMYVKEKKTLKQRVISNRMELLCIFFLLYIFCMLFDLTIVI